MLDLRLCPLCAKKIVLASSREEALVPAGQGGFGLDCVIDLSMCEQGHAFLRVTALNNSSESLPIREISITANVIDKDSVEQKWFGPLCSHKPEAADSRTLKFAVALEAMSKTVDHIDQLVSRLWETSIGQVDAESGTELKPIGAESGTELKPAGAE